MTKEKYANALEWFCNVIEACSVIAILALAGSVQWVFHELPCPLCLLQRVGLFLAAFGFLMNMRFGFHPSHYSMAILGALFTSLVALRQIALHVVPGTGWYGSPILGLHLYTWSYLVSMAVVVATTIIFGLNRQYLVTRHQSKSFMRLTGLLFGLLFILVALNLVSVFSECGITECPDNPEHYLF